MNLKRNQEGVVLIEFAVLLPLLILIIALAVDVGYWMFQINKAQTAAGAAAQAASYTLPDEEAAAARAVEIAELNGFNAEAVQVEISGDIVTVKVTDRAVTWFSAILISEGPVLKGRAVFSGPGGD